MFQQEQNEKNKTYIKVEKY